MASLDKNTAQSFDEIEDLTRFADESFDTDEINLFEFSDQEDSSLTRLKSVILSLDWEISDDILNELFEEVGNQKSRREGDKVSQIYLQALEKVGKYLKAEGAYAHPNAIKLLLTLYYNFEKILSSPDISSDEITILLKSDIRKFKVLQFQISIRDEAPIQSIEKVVSSTETVTRNNCELLDCIHATILGLEWEVTDEGLEKFNKQVNQLREELLDNTFAHILLQGLQALGAYISEEKVHAHPDAFTLLHSFYDGLKTLVLEKKLDNEQRQEILIDKVTLLNNLKKIISQEKPQEPVEAADAEIDQILDLENTETRPENEEGTITVPSEDSLSADALQLVLDAEEDGTEGEPAGEHNDAESFFDDEIQKSTYPVNAAMETAVDKYPEDTLEPDAIQPVSDTIADDLIEEDSRDKNVPEEQLELLLSDDDEEKQELVSDTDSLENVLDDLKLDFDKERTTSDDMSSMVPETVDESVDIKEDEELNKDTSLDLDDKLDALFGTVDAEPSKKHNDTNHDDVSPALTDTDSEDGFNEDLTAAELSDDSPGELQDKLDSLFGSNDEDSTIFLEEELDSLFTEDEAQGTDEQTNEPSGALADFDEENGFNEELTAAELDEDSSGELQGKLDSLFGSSDEEPGTNLEEELDSPFTADKDQDTDEMELDLSESFGDDADQIKLEKDQAEPLHDVAIGITVISSLVTAADTVATTPEPEDLEQIAALVTTGKKENPSPQQNVLLTLIDASASLLSKDLEAAAGRSSIIQELIAGFEDPEKPATLVEAVSRYTSWQMDFFTACMRTRGSSAPASPSLPTEENIISKVEQEFSQLRKLMIQEFDTLKNELKKE